MSDSKRFSDDDLGEVLFEFVTVGNAVKVSVVHVETNTEVSIVGAPGMSDFTLQANAIRKLRAALNRGGEETPPPVGSGRKFV